MTKFYTIFSLFVFLDSQVVLDYWQRHDIKGALNAISKMGDHSVSIILLSSGGWMNSKTCYATSRYSSFLLILLMLQVLADVMCLLSEKTDVVTLDICSCLLPLLAGLLESDMDR